MPELSCREEQSKEIVKLTTGEAQQALENSVALINKMRPPKSTWVEYYYPETPLRKKESSSLLLLIDAVMLGGAGGLLGIIYSVITEFVTGTSSESLAGWHMVIGSVLGVSALATCSLPKFIASGYKGSQAKQPIRAKLARLFYKKELDALEYRLRDYEAYQQALEAHQIVIDRERQKLEEQKVFEILSAGDKFVTLSKNGRIETVDKPFKDIVVGERYKDASLRIINYLQDEKKAIDSKTNTAQ